MASRVVVGVGAVGGAHLDQAAAGLGHDVRDAERTANFHQLAARNHHFAPGGQCAQGEQHGSGVVVHDGGGLGPGELADQVGYQVIAVAPAPVLQVVFQVHWAGQGLGHALHHLLRQQGAAQVGVQHGAGEVEHGFQARRKARALGACCTWAAMAAGAACAALSVPLRSCARRASSTWRSAAVALLRPQSASSGAKAASRSRASTEGMRGERGHGQSAKGCRDQGAGEGVDQAVPRRRCRPAPRPRPRTAGGWRWRVESAFRSSASPASGWPGRRPGARPAGLFLG